MLCAVLVSGCALTPQTPAGGADLAGPTPAQRREILVGKWLSDLPDAPASGDAWLDELRHDGTFVISFRVREPQSGVQRIEREAGDWGLAGDVFFTITRGWLQPDGKVKTADPANADLYDAFQVIELTASQVTMQDVRTGARFRMRRVADDHELRVDPAGPGRGD